VKGNALVCAFQSSGKENYLDKGDSDVGGELGTGRCCLMQGLCGLRRGILLL
jgi:hypothetical protein